MVDAGWCFLGGFIVEISGFCCKGSNEHEKISARGMLETEVFVSGFLDNFLNEEFSRTPCILNEILFFGGSRETMFSNWVLLVLFASVLWAFGRLVIQNAAIYL